MQNKAIFLDRDGVINRERGEYTFKAEDFEFNPGLLDALEILFKKGFILLIITNQAGIARGLYTSAEVEFLNKIVINYLSEREVKIAEIYYCPHHPSCGKCLCRKPGSLMLEKAIARFNIDPGKSFFIGDSERDMAAAEKAGVRGILIKPNEPLTKYLSEID